MTTLRTSLPRSLRKLSIIVALSLACTSVSFAYHTHRHHHKKSVCTKPVCNNYVYNNYYRNYGYYYGSNFFGVGLLRCPHWYVGGDIGVSRVHDNATTPSASVSETGPGWGVNVGYNFLNWGCWSTWGLEAGYTQFAASRENITGFNVARTEHYIAYLAAVAKVPLGCNFGLIGKAGGAYVYARKTFIASGATASGDVVSPYGALGLTYDVTRSVSFVGLWERARGNRTTGSNDLLSFGVSVKLC